MKPAEIDSLLVPLATAGPVVRFDLNTTLMSRNAPEDTPPLGCDDIGGATVANFGHDTLAFRLRDAQGSSNNMLVQTVAVYRSPTAARNVFEQWRNQAAACTKTLGDIAVSRSAISWSGKGPVKNTSSTERIAGNVLLIVYAAAGGEDGAAGRVADLIEEKIDTRF